MKKLFLILAVVAVLGAAGWGTVSWFSQREPERVEPTANWRTYTNTQYGFEIRYPDDWEVRFFDDTYMAAINVYKKSEPGTFPLTHHSPVTQVSIFPKGVPTEGVASQSQKSTLVLQETPAEQIDMVLADGTVWGTFASGFPARPSSWEEWGFIWAAAKVFNGATECYRGGQAIDESKCDPLGGDEIHIRGEIRREDRDTVERIARTFRFLRQ